MFEDEELKMQRLEWTDLDGDYRCLEGNEDYIDVQVGKLMDTYWDPVRGLAIKWTITDLS